jgi:hypothetical protein
VDVRDTSGSTISAPGARHVVRGYIGDYDEASVNRLIRQIIADNRA